MSVVIRSMQDDEAETVAHMVRALARDQGSDIIPKLTAAKLLAARDLIDIVVAQDEAKLLGACLWLMTYSTWRARKGVYIVDLYVASEARNRRIGEGRGLTLEFGVKPSRQPRWRGAEVDHSPAELGLGNKPTLSQAYLLDFLAARQGKEDGAAACGNLVNRGALHAVGGQPLERRVIAVGGEDGRAALARKIAAHRLAHGSDADKADHVRHVSPL